MLWPKWMTWRTWLSRLEHVQLFYRAFWHPLDDVLGPPNSAVWVAHGEVVNVLGSSYRSKINSLFQKKALYEFNVTFTNLFMYSVLVGCRGRLIKGQLHWENLAFPLKTITCLRVWCHHWWCSAKVPIGPTTFSDWWPNSYSAFQSDPLVKQYDYRAFVDLPRLTIWHCW